MKTTLPAFLAFLPMALCAAEDAVEGMDGTAEAVSGMTIKSIVTQGGAIMYFIVALSVAALVLIIYYLLTLRLKLIVPDKFINAFPQAFR